MLLNNLDILHKQHELIKNTGLRPNYLLVPQHLKDVVIYTDRMGHITFNVSGQGLSEFLGMKCVLANVDSFEVAHVGN